MFERMDIRQRRIRLCSSAWLLPVLLALACRGTASTVTLPRAIYRSTGTVAYMTPQPDGTGQHFVVAEWASIRTWPPTSLEKSPLRFVRLDLETGDNQTIGEIEESPFLMLFEGSVSVAPTGRIAFIAPSGSPYPIQVIEADGSRRIVKQEEADLVGGPRWRPDSTRLLFAACNLPEPGMQVGSARLLDIPRDGTASEEALPGVSGWSATWSSDGSAIYSLWPTGQKTARIEAVSWPSLTRRVLATAAIPYVNEYYPLRRILIAEDTGDLVWLSPSEARSDGARFEVWRMQPGAEPRRSALRLSAAPEEVAVSPDGRRLALARSDGCLALGDLDTGAKALLPSLPSRLRGRVWLGWAQQGRALIAASSGGHEVWLVPITSGATTPE